MKTANFRDVAESINSLHPTPILRPGLLYRSANLHATPALPALTTVLDLRTPTERALFPSSSSSAAAAWTTEAVDFFNNSFSKALVWRLPWLRLLWVLLLVAVGQRLRAGRVVARNVLVPAGLAAVVTMSLDHAQAEIRGVLEVLSSEERYPVLVHCTQGKDRTGLVVMVVLLLLAVEVADVEVDYMRSNDGLVAVREEMMRELRESGFAEEFAFAPRGLVGDVVRHLEDGWGGVEGYCDAIGFGKDGRERIRSILRVE